MVEPVEDSVVPESASSVKKRKTAGNPRKTGSKVIPDAVISTKIGSLDLIPVKWPTR